MKKASAIVLVALLLLTCRASAADNIKAYFSPNGGCTAAITNMLTKAQSSVYIATYSFTSAPIADALVKAHKRGVKVYAVMDDSNQSDKYSGATFLANAGIPVLVDSKHAIHHNKFMVIDSAYVITGSFNFSKAAEERNAENLLVIADKQLAQQYLTNWTEHQKHSTVYQKKAN